MIRETRSDESGFTLVELLVGIAMMLIITFAAVSMFTSVLNRTKDTTKTADVVGDARLAVEKLTSEIREGQKATLVSSYELKLVSPCTSSSAGCEAVFKCALETGKTTYACTKTAAGATTTLVSGLTSRNVFCVYPTSESTVECGKESTSASLAPRYVGIVIELPSNKSSQTGQTVFEDGVALHNNASSLIGQ
jgi:prepilin-type N-terminal cleavage/methylation domain-containing protein